MYVKRMRHDLGSGKTTCRMAASRSAECQHYTKNLTKSFQAYRVASGYTVPREDRSTSIPEAA